MRSERKRMVVLELLATGRMVRVAFTPDSEGVVVPDHLKELDALALDFGRHAPTPIDDLKATFKIQEMVGRTYSIKRIKDSIDLTPKS